MGHVTEPDRPEGLAVGGDVGLAADCHRGRGQRRVDAGGTPAQVGDEVAAEPGVDLDQLGTGRGEPELRVGEPVGEAQCLVGPGEDVQEGRVGQHRFSAVDEVADLLEVRLVADLLVRQADRQHLALEHRAVHADLRAVGVFLDQHDLFADDGTGRGGVPGEGEVLAQFGLVLGQHHAQAGGDAARLEHDRVADLGCGRGRFVSGADQDRAGLRHAGGTGQLAGQVLVPAAQHHLRVATGQPERLGHLGRGMDPRLVPAQHAGQSIAPVQLGRGSDHGVGVQGVGEHRDPVDVLRLPGRFGRQEQVDPVVLGQRGQQVLAEQPVAGGDQQQVRAVVLVGGHGGTPDVEFGRIGDGAGVRLGQRDDGGHARGTVDPAPVLGQHDPAVGQDGRRAHHGAGHRLTVEHQLGVSGGDGARCIHRSDQPAGPNLTTADLDRDQVAVLVIATDRMLVRSLRRTEEDPIVIRRFAHHQLHCTGQSSSRIAKTSRPSMELSTRPARTGSKLKLASGMP